MTLEEKLQRAELLLQQIPQIEREIQRLLDEATRETYWLHRGDVIVTYRRQRTNLLRRVVTTPFYWMVDRISSYTHHRFKRGSATVWVAEINPNTGEISPSKGMCLQQYQLNEVTRIGHIDDHETTRQIDLTTMIDSAAVKPPQGTTP